HVHFDVRDSAAFDQHRTRLKTVYRFDQVPDPPFVVNHVEGPDPLGRRREGVEVEKNRAVGFIDVDRNVIDAERTIDVGDGNCSAATERDLDLGRTFPTRREKRARLLARGLRIAIELLGPELDEPRARKRQAPVEPARDMRREMIGAVAHGILLADHIREQRSLRRGPFPAIYLPGCYINDRISPKRTLADEAYRPAAAAERHQGSVV